MSIDTCIRCGKEIPEGYGHVCRKCEVETLQKLAIRAHEQTDILKEKIKRIGIRMEEVNDCVDCADYKRCPRRGVRRGHCQHWKWKEKYELLFYEGEKG